MNDKLHHSVFTEINKITSHSMFGNDNAYCNTQYMNLRKFVDSHNWLMDDIRRDIFGFKDNDLTELSADVSYIIAGTKSRIYQYDIFRDTELSIVLSNYVIFTFTYSIPDIMLYKKMMFYRQQGRKFMLVNDEYTELVHAEIMESNILMQELVSIIIKFVSYV